ncbi:MAG: hypothetical protein JST54_24590 [Deltaproteobacteria bacterium]|nr:hypothetical protein [Deltaproteobacteria bacterium]
MRGARWTMAILPLAVAAMAGGCNCGKTPPPTPITLVATNDLDFDIFVPDESGQGGLTVGHQSGTDFAPVPEKPACPCLECDQACNFEICQCAPTPMAHRIRPGQSFTRTFDGNQHPASRASCGAGDLGPVCFLAGEPIETDNYDLQLCFATDVTGSSAGTDDFPATFDSGSLTCLTKTFAYPGQTTWTIAPTPPPPCGAGNACPSGQLCQHGVCSANCLANNVPSIGSSWDVTVNIVDDEGFFTRQAGTSPVRYTGTGQVGASSFSQGALFLPLARAEGAGEVVGSISVQLPSTITSVPFIASETVSLMVISQNNDPASPAGIVIRDASGNLILAAELDTGTRVLTDTDTAPVTVNGNGTAFACTQSDVCGRSLDTTVLFGGGNAQVEVEDGKSGPVTIGTTTYDATAVANFAGPASAPAEVCAPTTAFGYAILARRNL